MQSDTVLLSFPVFVGHMNKIIVPIKSKKGYRRHMLLTQDLDLSHGSSSPSTMSAGLLGSVSGFVAILSGFCVFLSKSTGSTEPGSLRAGSSFSPAQQGMGCGLCSSSLLSLGTQRTVLRCAAGVLMSFLFALSVTSQVVGM